MKFELINTPDERINATQQLFINRGIMLNDIHHYMNLTDDDINSPLLLGEEKLKMIAEIVRDAVSKNSRMAVIVDSDADGYTSAAILLNWFYFTYQNYYPNISCYLHDGKTHGLTHGAMEFIKDIDADLIWIPDASSNDIEQIHQLYSEGRKIIITDHHLLEQKESNEAIIINSQIDPYPNKELTGAGVTWQVCRYLDSINGEDYASKLIDLAATGQIADMSQLSSFETRRIISKGLEPDNIINPFLFKLWQKNMFKITDNPTDWKWTFYICPLINAITRSGTMEEKELIFHSMLVSEAFKDIPSNKRGHKPGEMETVVDQAIRTCTNVKNRQTRVEKASLEKLESLIEKNDMLKHKVLLFILKPEEIEQSIRGLVANKIMAKYQRCCAVLTDNGTDCAGSLRGCGLTGIEDFKGICEATGVVNWTIGHPNAAGLSISKVNIDKFLDRTDKLLADTAEEPMYKVDYIWTADNIERQKILQIAAFDPYIGQGFPEPLIAISNLRITKDNIKMMKSNTVKITTPSNVPIICFSMPDEEYEQLYSENGEIIINVIGLCNQNEWCGMITPQIIMKDYEIINKCAYVF